MRRLAGVQLAPSSGTFESIFCTGEGRRDNFLSRVFGVFSEEIPRLWCELPSSPYTELGRPTLWSVDRNRLCTLDFTLRERATGRVFVCEQKCELAFENYRYLRLTGPPQVAHHEKGSAAFRYFVAFARDPSSASVQVDGRPVRCDGAILIWGAATDEGARLVRKHYGLHDVLSLERMVAELNDAQSPAWLRRVSELRRWSDHLLDGLASRR